MAATWKAKAVGVGLWVLVVLEFLGMGLAGSAKFTTATWWSARFAEWGYPDGFSYLIGGLEFIGGFALLFPGLAAYAAMGLIVIMLGALVTVLTHPGRLGPGVLVAHLTLLSLILAGRWKVRWWQTSSTTEE